MESAPLLNVSVRVLGQLRRYLQGQHRVTLSVGQGATVGDAIGSLGVPSEELSIVRLNGKPADLAELLHTGDHIDIFSPLAGG